MLVSVTERARSGYSSPRATRGHIVSVSEALVRCMVGGFIGILVGSAGAIILSHVNKWNTSISPFAIGLAFLFSAVVGVLFGVWPARRAAGLDPIIALRYE
jgi:ABC-type antimicrobial peptide transport system permease subunit